MEGKLIIGRREGRRREGKDLMVTMKKSIKLEVRDVGTGISSSV